MDTHFQKELEMFQAKGQDLVELLAGEIERIINYAEKRYIVKEEIPAHVMMNYEIIKLHGHTPVESSRTLSGAFLL